MSFPRTTLSLAIASAFLFISYSQSAFSADSIGIDSKDGNADFPTGVISGVDRGLSVATADTTASLTTENISINANKYGAYATYGTVVLGDDATKTITVQIGAPEAERTSSSASLYMSTSGVIDVTGETVNFSAYTKNSSYARARGIEFGTNSSVSIKAQKSLNITANSQKSQADGFYLYNGGSSLTVESQNIDVSLLSGSSSSTWASYGINGFGKNSTIDIKAQTMNFDMSSDPTISTAQPVLTGIFFAGKNATISALDSTKASLLDINIDGKLSKGTGISVSTKSNMPAAELTIDMDTINVNMTFDTSQDVTKGGTLYGLDVSSGSQFKLLGNSVVINAETPNTPVYTSTGKLSGYQHSGFGVDVSGVGTFVQIGEEKAQQVAVTVQGYNRADGAHVEKGNVIFNGDDIKVSAVSAQRAYGLLALGSNSFVTVNGGDVDISTTSEQEAVALMTLEPDTAITINADSLKIVAKGDGGLTQAIWAQSNSELEASPDNRSTIAIHANNTQIDTTGIGLVALSNSQIDIDGGLTLKTGQIVHTRGHATININHKLNGTVVLEGDVVFGTPGAQENSGEIIDAAVNINLVDSNSYWTGAVSRLPAPNVTDRKYTDIAKGVTLNLSNGATWNVTGDSFINTLVTDTGIVNINNNVSELQIGSWTIKGTDNQFLMGEGTSLVKYVGSLVHEADQGPRIHFEAGSELQTTLGSVLSGITLDSEGLSVLSPAVQSRLDTVGYNIVDKQGVATTSGTATLVITDQFKYQLAGVETFLNQFDGLTLNFLNATLLDPNGENVIKPATMDYVPGNVILSNAVLETGLTDGFTDSQALVIGATSTPVNGLHRTDALQISSVDLGVASTVEVGEVLTLVGANNAANNGKFIDSTAADVNLNVKGTTLTVGGLGTQGGQFGATITIDDKAKMNVKGDANAIDQNQIAFSDINANGAQVLVDNRADVAIKALNMSGDAEVSIADGVKANIASLKAVDTAKISFGQTDVTLVDAALTGTTLEAQKSSIQSIGKWDLSANATAKFTETTAELKELSVTDATIDVVGGTFKATTLTTDGTAKVNFSGKEEVVISTIAMKGGEVTLPNYKNDSLSTLSLAGDANFVLGEGASFDWSKTKVTFADTAKLTVSKNALVTATSGDLFVTPLGELGTNENPEGLVQGMTLVNNGTVSITDALYNLAYAEEASNLLSGGKVSFLGTLIASDIENLNKPDNNVTLNDLSNVKENVALENVTVESSDPDVETIQIGGTVPAGQEDTTDHREESLYVAAVNMGTAQKLNVQGGETLGLAGNGGDVVQNDAGNPQIKVSGSAVLALGTETSTKGGTVNGSVDVEAGSRVTVRGQGAFTVNVVTGDGDILVGNGNTSGDLTVGNLDGHNGFVFTDPSWDVGSGVENASVLAVNDYGTDLTSKLVAGRHGMVVVGSDAATAQAAFNKLADVAGLSWNKGNVEAGLYVGKTIKVGTDGGVLVDGSLAALDDAKTAFKSNQVTIASNGIMIVDQNMSGPAVDGKLVMEDGSHLGVMNTAVGTFVVTTDTTFDGSGVKVVTDTPFIVSALSGGTLTNTYTAEGGLSALSAAGMQAMMQRADTMLATSIADRTSFDQELANGLNLWVDASAERLDTDGAVENAGFKADVGYGAFGADVALTDNVVAGMAIQYGKGSLRGDQSVKNELDNYGVALYGSWKCGNAKLVGDVSYIQGKNDITAAQSAMNQEVDTKIASAGLRAQYRMTAGAFEFVPSIGVRVSRLETDAMDIGATKVQKQEQTLVQVPVAMRINGSTQNLGAGWNVMPSFKIAYVPTFGDEEIAVQGGKLDVIDTNPVQGEMGMRFAKDNMMVNVNMTVGGGDNGKSAVGGKVGFKYVF